jgi:4-hydroxybenzoate polyprenyltransferase
LILRLPPLLRLVRWPGAVTAAVNAMTGFLVTHSGTTHDEAVAASCVAVAGAIVYSGGVVLNDVADAERDAQLHPTRPIPLGLVQPTSAALFGVALFVIGILLATFLGGPWSGAAMAGAAVLAFLYDFGLKRSRVGGALVLGLARAANGLAGVLTAAHSVELGANRAIVYPIALLAYTALLTYASTFEGRTPSKRLAGTFAVALFVAAAMPWAVFGALWHEAPALAYVPLAVTLIVAAREAAEEGSAGMGILVRTGVFGFLLADAAWLEGIGRYQSGFALILAYVALRLFLARSRS